MTRHHAEPNINILLTRNLFFDTDVRQWGHRLMIPLHVCELNGTTEPVANLNVTWLGFVFILISFDHMHSAIVVPACLRFQVVQIKQVDYKMSTKNVNN